MKKYSTNYLEWLSWFLSYIFLLAVLSFGVYKGLTYDKKYSMDLTGYILTIVMLATVGLVGWEMTTLFDFLLRGTPGEIYISNTELTIPTKDGQKTFKWNDIKTIEFVSPRIGTKSVTSSISHCKLVFSSQTIFLTSFTIKNEEIAQNLKIRTTNVRNRERRYFELMH